MKRSLLALVLTAGPFGAVWAMDSISAINFDHENPVSGGTFPRGEIWDYLPSHSHGYNFRVTETARLTHLGMYDDFSDGLVGDYLVGLWSDLGYNHTGGPSRNIGELIVEGEVLGEEQSELSGSWRLVDVPDVVLAPGDYVVAAVLEENAQWREDRDSCEASSFPDFCDFIGVPEDPPVPLVDQYYWLQEGSLETMHLIAGDPRIAIVGNSTGGTAPHFSTESGFSAPDEVLLVAGLFVGPTIFIEPIPEPTAVALSLLAISAAGLIRRRA